MNRMKPLAVAAGVVLAVSAASGSAQQTTWHGEIRPRYEIRDPLGGGPDEFTSMRLRVAIESRLDASVSFFAQLQDVRLWGEEASPLGDYRADNIDLHQGYLRIHGQRLPWLTSTIGRMEATFGGERLVGPVGWAQQGQSFDGARLDVERGWGDVALVAFKIGEASAPSVSQDSELYGAYGTVRDIGPGSLDVYWLFNRIEGLGDTDQHSVGSRYVFSAGRLNGRVEGTLQKGTRAAVDVSAFMIGARLGATLLPERLDATLWYDYLSGDDPATPAVEVFHTLYATGHKFYGFADLFLDIPAHTAGAGLQDMALKLALRATDRVRFAADLHSFRAAEQGTLSGSHFGDELDLSVTRRHSEHLTATVGFSYILQDDAWAEIGRLDEDMKWLYVMLSAAF